MNALDLSGQVVWNDVCPGWHVRLIVIFHGFTILYDCKDALSLGRAKVALDNGRLSGGVMADGSFTMCVSDD